MTLLSMLPLLVLLQSAPAAEPLVTVENWNAGLDTTKSGWYFEHPVWLAIKDRFRKRCDSIESAWKPKLVATTDTIRFRDSVQFAWYKPEPKWLRVQPATQETGFDLFVVSRVPTPLRTAPHDTIPPFALLPAGTAPWKVVAALSADLIGPSSLYIPDTEKIERILKKDFRYKTPAYVLLADTLGVPRGWVRIADVRAFETLEQAVGVLPFYRDGLADFLDGTWMTARIPKWDRPVFADFPMSRRNPPTQMKMPCIAKIDLGLGIYQILLDRSEGFHDHEEADEILNKNLRTGSGRSFEFTSEARHPKSGKPYRYLDPVKLDRMDTLASSSYSYNWLERGKFSPWTLDPRQRGAVIMRRARNSNGFDGAALVIQIDQFSKEPQNSGRQLVFNLPVMSISDAYLELSRSCFLPMRKHPVTLVP